eukprot:403358360
MSYLKPDTKQQKHQQSQLSASITTNWSSNQYQTADVKYIPSSRRSTSPQYQQLDYNNAGVGSRGVCIKQSMDNYVNPQKQHENPKVNKNMYYSALKKLVGKLGTHTSQEQLNEMLKNFNNYDSVSASLQNMNGQLSTAANTYFTHGLRENQHSENIIHFQDPKSAKVNGSLNKPLINTQNKRNDTSYNFINIADQQKPHQVQQQKFGKRITSQEVSPKKTVVNIMLQPDNFKDQNRPPSTASVQRYQAKSLNSNHLNDIVFNENKNILNEPQTSHLTKRSPQRQFIDSSGIQCLPGSYQKYIKDVKPSESTLATYKKVFEGNNQLPQGSGDPSYGCNIMKRSASNVKLRSSIQNFYSVQCSEPQILTSNKSQQNLKNSKPNNEPARQSLRMFDSSKPIQSNKNCYRDVSPNIQTFGSPSIPGQSEYQIIKDHRPKTSNSQQRYNQFYKSNVSFY